MKTLVLAAVLARQAELKKQIHAAREKVRAAAAAQHASLALTRTREKDGLRAVKLSAADPETVHVALHDVREKSRRERKWARAARKEERARLLDSVKKWTAELRALRKR